MPRLFCECWPPDEKGEFAFIESGADFENPSALNRPYRHVVNIMGDMVRKCIKILSVAHVVLDVAVSHGRKVHLIKYQVCVFWVVSRRHSSLAELVPNKTAEVSNRL